MQNEGKACNFLKKQRKGRQYIRFRATAGLVKAAMLLESGCQCGERVEAARPQNTREKTKGELRQRPFAFTHLPLVFKPLS